MSFGDQLAGAAWTRNLAKLKELIPQGDVNMPNSRGQTALYCACRQGYVEIVLELLKAPNINVNVQVTEHGGTPLHASGFYGFGEVTALLLASGAKEHLTNKLGLTAHQDMKGECIEVYKIFQAEGRSGLQKKYASIKQLPAPKNFITAAISPGARKPFRVNRSPSTTDIGKTGRHSESSDPDSPVQASKRRGMRKTESSPSLVDKDKDASESEDGTSHKSKSSGSRRHRHKEKDKEKETSSVGSSHFPDDIKSDDEDAPSGKNSKGGVQASGSATPITSMMEMEVDWDYLPNFSSFLPQNYYGLSNNTGAESESESASTATSTATSNLARNYSLFIECGQVPVGLSGEIRSPFEYVPSPLSYKDQYYTFIQDEPTFHLEEGRIPEDQSDPSPKGPGRPSSLPSLPQLPGSSPAPSSPNTRLPYTSLASSPFSFSKKPPNVVLNSDKTYVLRRNEMRRRGASVLDRTLSGHETLRKTDKSLQDMQDSLSELQSVLRGANTSPNSSSGLSSSSGLGSSDHSSKNAFYSELTASDMMTFTNVESNFPVFTPLPLPPYHPRMFGVGEEDKAEQMRKMKDFILDSLELGLPYIKSTTDSLTPTVTSNSQVESKAKIIMKKLLKRSATTNDLISSPENAQPSAHSSPSINVRAPSRPAPTPTVSSIFRSGLDNEAHTTDPSAPGSPHTPPRPEFATLTKPVRSATLDGSSSPRGHIPVKRFVTTSVAGMGSNAGPEQGVIGAVPIRPLTRPGLSSRYLTAAPDTEDAQQAKSEEENAPEANESPEEQGSGSAMPALPSFPTLPTIPPTGNSPLSARNTPLPRPPVKPKKPLPSPRKSEQGSNEENATDSPPTPRDKPSPAVQVPTGIQTNFIIPPRIKTSTETNPALIDPEELDNIPSSANSSPASPAPHSSHSHSPQPVHPTTSSQQSPQIPHSQSPQQPPTGLGRSQGIAAGQFQGGVRGGPGPTGPFQGRGPGAQGVPAGALMPQGGFRPMGGAPQGPGQGVMGKQGQMGQGVPQGQGQGAQVQQGVPAQALMAQQGQFRGPAAGAGLQGQGVGQQGVPAQALMTQQGQFRPAPGSPGQGMQHGQGKMGQGMPQGTQQGQGMQQGQFRGQGMQQGQGKMGQGMQGTQQGQGMQQGQGIQQGQGQGGQFRGQPGQVQPGMMQGQFRGGPVTQQGQPMMQGQRGVGPGIAMQCQPGMRGGSPVVGRAGAPVPMQQQQPLAQPRQSNYSTVPKGPNPQNPTGAATGAPAATGVGTTPTSNGLAVDEDFFADYEY